MTDIRYRSYGYPAPEYDAGLGRWNMLPPDSLVEGDFGSFRIEVGAQWDTYGTAYEGNGSAAVKTADGSDVTDLSDAPSLLESLSFGEPYGETTGSLTLAWMTPFSEADVSFDNINVDIWRVLPADEAVAAGTAEVPYWHGFVASQEMSDGYGIDVTLTLHLLGAMYGEASLRAHMPLMLDTSSDAGTWAGRALSPELYSRPLTPFCRFSYDSDTTDIDVRYRGSRGQSTIDYLDELLTLAQDGTFGQATISRAYQTLGGRTYPRARHYYLRAKSEELAAAVQQNYIAVGGYGINLSVSKDTTETPNAIYGEGVAPNGGRWRNARYPLLTTSAPAYPTRGGTASTYPITVGDTDADFDVDAITQASSQLRVSGWPDVTVTSTFDSDMADAITALKEDIGWANTTGNIGGTAEWAMLWGEGGTGFTDLSSGFFQPLAVDSAVRRYDYASDGDVTGENPDFDPSVLRVDRVISYGDGITKKRARINARRLVNSTAPAIIGTIKLTSDPTDENGDGRSRLEIREGGWIRVNNLGIFGNEYEDFYIAGITHQPEVADFPTTLTVSTVAFDLLDLSTRIQRNKDAKSDPAKSFYSQRVQSVRPFKSAVGWDAESGAGTIPPFAAAGSAWTVKQIVGAQYGSIESLRIEASSAVGYCFAVFGGSVSGTALDALVPTPLAALGTADGSYPSWWSHPDNEADLTSWGFIEAWGSSDEIAGYYPGASSIGTAVAGGSATGALEDAGSWRFASLEPPYLWVAVWPATGGTPTFSGTMRIAADE